MRRTALLVAPVAFVTVVLSGCFSDPNDPQTWIKKLDDPRESKEAVRQLVKLKDKQAVAPLIEQYKKTKDPEQIRAIASFADPSSVPVLIDALDFTESSYDAASIAATALGEIGDKSAIGALSKAATKSLSIKSRANIVRVEAIKALIKMKDPRTVDTFISILSRTADEQDFYLNKLAAQALGDVPDPKAVPALVRGLFMTGRGGAADIYQPCRTALITIGDPAVDKVVETLQRKNTEVEEDAKKYEFIPGIVVQKTSSILGDLRARRAVPALLEELKKPDEGLAAGEGKGVSGHQSIILALGQIGDPSAVKPLAAIAADAKKPQKYRVAAGEALNILGDQSALPALAAIAKTKWLKGHDIDTDAAQLAASGITSYSRLAGPKAPLLGLPKIDPELAEMVDVAKAGDDRIALAKECGEDVACYGKALKDPNAARVEKAAYSLSRLGKAALPQLLKHLGNKDQGVRLTVLFGIGRIADGSCTECKKALDEQIATDESKGARLRGMVDEMHAVRAMLSH